MTAPVELVIVERGGVRLGVPARRIAAISDLPQDACDAQLQQRLGQPPPDEDERCFELWVDEAGGDASVTVTGRVSMAVVSAADIALLPELLGGVAPITAVVFDGDAPVLVLDADAMVAHARAGR